MQSIVKMLELKLEWSGEMKLKLSVNIGKMLCNVM